jgi:rhamnosyltransferase
MSIPLISIVVPVKNGEFWLESFFNGMKSQTIYHKCEIIIIDSGSSDRSVDICKQHGAVVYSIPAENFNHGLTRNLGWKKANGKYILLTVQDAVPENEYFLSKMLECLESGDVAAVCGMQIVPELPETNPFHWHRPMDIPEIRYYQFKQPALFDSLPPGEKKQICCWDDVCAMYSKGALEKVPFREVFFGEDMAWCVDALRDGLRICYQPSARVFHYHLDEPKYNYKRTINELYSSYDYFKYIPGTENMMIAYLKLVKLIAREKKISLGKKWYWFRTEMKNRQIIQKATRDFLKYYNKGERELYEFCAEICSLPTQAPKGKLL